MTTIRKPSPVSPFPRYPTQSERCETRRPSDERCSRQNDRYDSRTPSCEKPGSKPCSDYDLRKYQKGLEHCPSRELHGRYETCRREERECHSRGDKVGANNCGRKAELCQSAIACRRGELSDCRSQVKGMNDRQLGDYASGLEDQLRNPREDSRRGPVCEKVQICRREQHQRLCDKHFPGTQPHCGTQTRGEEGRSVDEVIKCLGQRGGRYQEAMNGPEVRPLEGREAMQGVERDLQQLVGLLAQPRA